MSVVTPQPQALLLRLEGYEGPLDLLLELAEYADGLRRRMRAPAREAVPA